MKKGIISKIMALTLMIVCFSSATAFAATDNIGVSTTVPTIDSGGITIDSTSCPDTSNLYDNGTYYTVSGSANSSDLFTNKCFYGVTSIDYNITNNYSSSLKVKLCYYTALGNVIYGTQSVTIPAGGTTTAKFSSLSSSKYYFIEFCGPSDFSGKVRGNN